MGSELRLQVLESEGLQSGGLLVGDLASLLGLVDSHHIRRVLLVGLRLFEHSQVGVEQFGPLEPEPLYFGVDAAN